MPLTAVPMNDARRFGARYFACEDLGEMGRQEAASCDCQQLAVMARLV